MNTTIPIPNVGDIYTTTSVSHFLLEDGKPHKLVITHVGTTNRFGETCYCGCHILYHFTEVNHADGICFAHFINPKNNFKLVKSIFDKEIINSEIEYNIFDILNEL